MSKEGRSITITFLGMPPKELRGNSLISPKHRTRWKKRQKFETESLLQSALVGRRDILIYTMPFPKARIDYDIHYWGKPIDYDNFLIGMKYAQDTLVDFGIIPDDSPNYLVGVGMVAQKAESKDDVRVVLKITELLE